MKSINKILLYLFLFFVALIMVFPLFWMILLSFKKFPDGNTNLIDLITSSYSLINYIDAFKADNFGRYFINSIIVSTCVTVGNLIFCLMTAYALSRKEFILNKFLFFTVLTVIIVPPHVIMIPLYKLMVNFNWINTYFALIVPWLITPFGIFLLKQYIDVLPHDIEDAARIDGANEWYILFKIVAPLSKPILTVLAIYTFLGNWNSFLFPFLFTNHSDFRTLPVGLAFYLGKQSVDWGHLMAGAAISGLPIIIIFILFQKQIIQGLTAGALKE
ncbi:MAG TPA: carbohydrate ABC transporter permease [Candidatus Kapabacteria bacterium]|nr:carbohydrate ABC transporter permease [Candidatus Kapabacteria bacterium]